MRLGDLDEMEFLAAELHLGQLALRLSPRISGVALPVIAGPSPPNVAMQF